MKLSDKLSILAELGIIDWLSECSNDENLRVIVNSIAEHFFEDKSVFSFAPACEIIAIYDHFTETGYDIDWYDLITFNFAKAIEEDCRDQVHIINYDKFIMPNEELKVWISDWINEWSSVCKKSFTQALQVHI